MADGTRQLIRKIQLAMFMKVIQMQMASKSSAMVSTLVKCEMDREKATDCFTRQTQTIFPTYLTAIGCRVFQQGADYIL
ncbi:hypothetical protein FGO68_gene9706 [Halteria grandinella]|uniref:Uncharacterized protein n=1 Tax=Halteria grandinella TaxID=5974 RepID=A0A8J8NWC7_HALGN|nr:hypothetical protein FGO68_gene9706 [Halteria grandinella]